MCGGEFCEDCVYDCDCLWYCQLFLFVEQFVECDFGQVFYDQVGEFVVLVLVEYVYDMGVGQLGCCMGFLDEFVLEGGVVVEVCVYYFQGDVLFEVEIGCYVDCGYFIVGDLGVYVILVVDKLFDEGVGLLIGCYVRILWRIV